MSEAIRARLLLARFHGDTEPVIVAALDQSVWEHIEEEDEKRWRADAERLWGMDPSDCEWAEVWAEFAPDDLAAAFKAQSVQGSVSA